MKKQTEHQQPHKYTNWKRHRKMHGIPGGVIVFCSSVVAIRFYWCNFYYCSSGILFSDFGSFDTLSDSYSHTISRILFPIFFPIFFLLHRNASESIELIFHWILSKM